MSAQALSPEWLVLETQDSHTGPRTKQEQVFKQELILDSRLDSVEQLWSVGDETRGGGAHSYQNVRREGRVVSEIIIIHWLALYMCFYFLQLYKASDDCVNSHETACNAKMN